MSTLKRIQVLLTPEQTEALRAMSAKQGASVSWIVREAVRIYLAQRQLVDARVVWTPGEDKTSDGNE